MRRHLIVLALVAGSGAGSAVYWFMADGEKREGGVVASAGESAAAGRDVSAVRLALPRSTPGRCAGICGPISGNVRAGRE